MDWENEFKDLSKDELEIKLREYVEEAKSSPAYSEDRYFRLRIIQLENHLNNLSDIRGKEISEKLLLEIEMDVHRRKTEKMFYDLRTPIIQELKKDPANELLRQTALRIIQIEKDHKIYNPDNWKDLPVF